MKDNQTETIQVGILAFVVIVIIAAMSTCQKRVTDARLKCLNDGHSIEECKLL